MVDRHIISDSFVSFVTASDHALGRFAAQWMAEKLGGTGNIIMLGDRGGEAAPVN